MSLQSRSWNQSSKQTRLGNLYDTEAGARARLSDYRFSESRNWYWQPQTSCKCLKTASSCRRCHCSHSLARSSLSDIFSFMLMPVKMNVSWLPGEFSLACAKNSPSVQSLQNTLLLFFMFRGVWALLPLLPGWWDGVVRRLNTTHLFHRFTCSDTVFLNITLHRQLQTLWQVIAAQRLQGILRKTERLV